MSGKNITASVGAGGTNMPLDAATIQYLLNCVPVSHGGPVEELEIDGFAGPLTCQAIRDFQRAQLGWSDGRVDPEQLGGQTIVRLKTYDPQPATPLNFKPYAPSGTPQWWAHWGGAKGTRRPPGSKSPMGKRSSGRWRSNG